MSTADYLGLLYAVNLLLVLAVALTVQVKLSRKQFNQTYNLTKRRLTKSTREFIKYMEGHGRLNRWLLVLHLKYIEQTMLKKYIKAITVKWLMAGELLLFLLVMFIVVNKSGSFIVAMALGFVVAFVPMAILDGVRHYNMQRLRADIVHMFSLLGQWYNVTEDLMKSFEKVADHQLSEPLRTYVKEFVVQTHCGLDISQGLNILNHKVGSDFFSVFIVNIEQSIANRGDVGLMLKNLEEEAFRLQEEFNRRNISMYHDKVIIYITMLMVLVIGYQFLIINDVTERFYFHTTIGQWLMGSYCVLYIIGFVISTGISRLEY